MNAWKKTKKGTVLRPETLTAEPLTIKQPGKSGRKSVATWKVEETQLE